MTLVSSTSNNVSDIEFILGERSFIYIRNNKGPRIDPWGTPCFSVPQSEKNTFSCSGDFTSNFLSSVN
jgi:hypothetical protein